MKTMYLPTAVPNQTFKKSIKNVSLLFLVLLLNVLYANAQCTDFVQIPDTNFKTALLANLEINTDNNTEISCSEAANFTGTMDVRNLSITDLTGIEAFTNIDVLLCGQNSLTSLDLSNNTSLRILVCSINDIAFLDVSNNPLLDYLSCYENNLTVLDVSNNPALEYLGCSENSLSSLDVSNNPLLEQLRCQFNSLTSLDVSNNPLLEELFCYNNGIADLNLSNNPMLENLICSDNALAGLDVSNNTNLLSLNCSVNPIFNLDVSNNTALTSLYCVGNSLTSLDVSNNQALDDLRCYFNELTSLDVSNNPALTELRGYNNQLSSLNVANGNNTAIMVFETMNNPNLNCIQVDDPTYSTTNWTNIDTAASFSTDCSFVYIPDTNFKTALVNNTAINTDNDAEISYAEASAFSGTLDVPSLNIADLTGIAAFVNLTNLDCSNNALTSLDVSNNINLTFLGCSNNALTSLDLSANVDLEELTCIFNALTSLDVSNSTVLRSLYCNTNNLTGLDVSNNTVLESLVCGNNPLAGLDISNNPALVTLECGGATLTDLDISNNINLTELICLGNVLTGLDVSNNTELGYLDCSANTLSSLDVSNNPVLENLNCSENDLTALDVSNNPNLFDLNCEQNGLTSLNVANGNNTAITDFDATNNSDLNCIQVDDVAYSTNNWTNIDATASFSVSCPFITANGITYLITSTNPNTVRAIDNINTGAVTISGTVDYFGSYTVTSIGDNAFEENQLTNITIPDGVTSIGDNAFGNNPITEVTALGIAIVPALNGSAFTDRATIDLTIPFGASITDYENAGWTGFKSITYPLGVITVDDTDAAQHRATFTFDAPVSGFTVDAITLANATVVPDSFTGGDGDTVYTVDIAPDTTALTVANPYMTVSVDGSGQPLDYVYIPDTNFRDALINNPDIDTDGDDLIGPTEANAFTGSIDVRNLSITDLTGIGAFVNLFGLDCSDNDLTDLNVSNNTSLEHLFCKSNDVVTLDVSNNPALTNLNCSANYFLITLNVANGNNTAITDFDASNNTNLNCIQVDDVAYSTNNWTNIDAMASFSVSCPYITANGITYLITSTNPNTVSAIDNINTGAVTIPGTVDYFGSYTVTSIGVNAFRTNQLTSITIPDGVTTIEEGAFVFNEFTSITIPDGVTTIGASAFDYNFHLTSVTIGDGVTTIGSYAFRHNQLTSVTIPDGVTTIEDGVFSNNQLTGITIPDGVTTIGNDAFYSNELTSITIPDGVTSIGDNAFRGNQLTSVTIPDGVTTIEDGVFNNNQLTSVTIPDGVTSIGDRAFFRNELTSVTIPDGVTSIGDNAFEENQLTSVTIPDGVTSIGDNAFEENQLTSITIPDGVTSIGDYAFWSNPITEVTALGIAIVPALNGSPFTFAQRATIDLTIPFGASITDYENAGWTGFKSITYPLGVITVDDTDAAQHRATFTFDAPVSGFTVDAITLANATVVPDSFTGGDGDTVYTVDIAPDTTALTVANPYMTVSVDGSGQPLDYVYIPDTNFRDALINNPDIDTDGDDLIGPTEANAFTGSIGVRNLSITDLTGIGAFVNITDLNCSDNDLTGLNVSNNTELLYLQCFTTGLTSLDVIANTALRALNCRNNSLTSLDVSNNPDLTYLNCESNSLTSLNVASGNNTAIDYFFGTNNPNLSCIQVDDANYSSANWTAIDPSSSFSADCGYISTSSVSSKMAIGNTQVVANTVGTINDISFMDQTFAETISIYPNPVENTFNIGAPSGFQLKQAKIYSVLGEAVLSATTNQIDASYLPSGMYILKVEGANGKIMTKRIVKK